MQATMRTDVELVSTSLKLQAGQRVRLVRATNQPKESRIQFFAYPADGKWSDGRERSPAATIAVADAIGLHSDDLVFDHDFYAIDASDLGLKPGHFPMKVEFAGMLFNYAENHVDEDGWGYMLYVADNGAGLKIAND